MKGREWQNDGWQNHVEGGFQENDSALNDSANIVRIRCFEPLIYADEGGVILLEGSHLVWVEAVDICPV